MSNSTIVWKSDPDYRGTLNILTTCLSTLFICVWSAVHDDVPKGKGRIQIILRRIGWLVFGLIAPEVLLYISYHQYTIARNLLKEAEHVYGTGLESAPSHRRSWWTVLKRWKTSFKVPSDNESGTSLLPSQLPTAAAPPTPPEEGKRKHPWTLAHAFWASMGGFKLDAVDHEGERYLPDWQGEALITPQGIRFLLKNAPDLIPDISVQEIMEKSKADGLAKTLLVWQVLWFCINCGTRLVQRLPLSLLEVSTIAHGASTLITYCFWWEKPFNISEPIPVRLRTEEAAGIGAVMSMLSGAERNIFGGIKCIRDLCESHRLYSTVPRSKVLNAVNQARFTENSTLLMDPEICNHLAHQTYEMISRGSDSGVHVFIVPPQRLDTDTFNTSPQAQHVTSCNTNQSDTATYSNHDNVRLSENYSSDSTLHTIKRRWHSLVYRLRVYRTNFLYRGHPPWHSHVNYGRRPVDVDPTCPRRWHNTSLCEDHDRDHMMASHFAEHRSPLIVPVASLQCSLTLSSETRDSWLWYINNLWPDTKNIFVSAMLPAVYGMPHLLGWNAVFPTHAERVLWRAAALAVTTSGWAMLLLYGMFTGIRIVDKRCLGRRINIPFTRGDMPMWVFYVAILCYVAASGYLLVESFRQLFALPPGAFQLPSWVNMLPHFA